MTGKVLRLWQRVALFWSRPWPWPFGTVTALYAAITLTLGFLGLRQAPCERYVAARILLHGHRIVPEDIRNPPSMTGTSGFYLADRKTLEGKFVAVPAVCKGEPIRSSDVQSTPDLAASPHQRLVVFPLGSQPEWAHWLDVRAIVLLVGEDQAHKGTETEKLATVRAIVCEPAKDPKQGESCSVVLSLQEADEGVVSKNKAAFRLIPSVATQR